jgi:hypothetical protein
MKAADIEWSMLRGALIGLIIAVAISIGIIAASHHFWEGADRALKRSESALRASRDKYRTVDEQEAMIATYYPRFVELEGLGIVGGEKRLDWIESLRQADANLKLPSLTYSIGSQEPYKAEYPLAGGAYQPFVTKMDLKLGLLHGQDLFNLLASLDENAQGLYSVDTCNLQRRLEGPGSPRQAHVTSECKLRWFTIRKPGDKGGAS